jgi:large subunit ribosomal protein L4
MIEVPVKNVRGETVSTAELDERVWDIKPNRAVLHQAVVAQQANARRGTADTKTRGEIRGTGKKHHRQKGTGMARQGDVHAPHWRGGGVVFGPHPRDFSQKLPKKMRKLAMRSALSAKVDDAAVLLIDGFQLAQAKTKEMIRALETLEVSGRALVVLPERDALVERATGNLPKVRAVTPNTLNLLDVLMADRLVFTLAAAEAITEQLLRAVRPQKTQHKLVPPKRRAAPKATAAESAPAGPSSAGTAEPADEEAAE